MQPYSTALQSSFGTPPYTYALTSGSLPPGITLDQSGNITGTPTSTGSWTFQVRATDPSPVPVRQTTQTELPRCYPRVAIGPAASRGFASGSGCRIICTGTSMRFGASQMGTDPSDCAHRQGMSQVCGQLGRISVPGPSSKRGAASRQR